MFTGIIEEIGTIKNITSKAKSMTLQIEAKTILSDVKLGDSIAINGTCLTVTNFYANSFSVDIMPETFNTTSMKTLTTDAKVNLERSLPANGRIGGHFVTGHIDTTGTITTIKPEDNAVYLTINFKDNFLLKYCIYHGSIAIDGTSLTIFGITDDSITISLIPHTITHSIIGNKKIGNIVNIECDMLAKYVERTMQYSQNSNNDKSEPLTSIFLQQHGFI